jgi:hypothetical protein
MPLATYHGERLGLPTMLLRVPLSLFVCSTGSQFAGLRSGLSCNDYSVEGEGKEIVTAEGGELRVIVISGTPGGLNGGDHAPKAPCECVIATAHAPSIRPPNRTAHRTGSSCADLGPDS